MVAPRAWRVGGTVATQRWRQIENLFHSALEHDPDRRAAYLESACSGDTSLRHEVESLLSSYQRADFTERSAFDEGIRLLEETAVGALVGRHIGPYKVIRQIGQGGMGAVYLASRADEAFHMEVAIKLIKRGLDTDEVILRFRGERQILANLNHPNITALLDGGTTEEGLPYFVMEYIQGNPIDKYCDAKKLSILDRLKLFQSACAAVHYAHQHLVIHRDIKAGNILVTPEGVPRLLDFGIAKLLTAPPAVSNPTVTVARRMTPESASPEQVRGEVITTASDVYSLGVLLYKLLTGHNPYRLTSRSPEELEQAICTQVPEKPSVAIDRADEYPEGAVLTVQSVSETREGTPDKLRRRLQGDLDNIVLMALRKETQRRYASVLQFSEDIRNHIEGHPVIARRDTPGYRAAKFVGRHKTGVAATALLILSLSAGVAATVWQARVAVSEGQRARLESAKAQRINGFLQDMLSFSSPGYLSSNPRKDPNAKVSEVVDQAAKRAESELADQPEVLVEVQRTIGGVYFAQGRYDQAEQILRAALKNYRRLYAADGPESVEAANALANVLLRKGNTTEAEALFRRDIDIERKQAHIGHLDVRIMTQVLADYGSMLDQRGDKATADYLHEALQYASHLTGKDRTYIAMIDNDLGDVAYRRGDWNEAERLDRAAIEEYRKLPQGTYVEMAATLSNLGAVLIKEGKYDEAESFVREGLQLRQKLLGDSHPDTAMSLFRLSDLLYKKNDYSAAEDAARESVKVFTRAFTQPKDNPYFANPLLELGLILNKSGRSREAEYYLRQALEIRSRLMPKGNQLIAVSEGALGECLTTQKRFAEAEPVLQQSYATMKNIQGEQGPSTLEAKRRLAALYQAWGKPKEASRYLAEFTQPTSR